MGSLPKFLIMLISLNAAAAFAAGPRYIEGDIFRIDANGFHVDLIAPSTLPANYVLQLPANAGTSGQVLTTNGSGVLTWTTPAALGVTSVATGTGLTGGPITSTGTIAISNVPIANGGTAGTTAATARANLSAAQSGANTDITSLQVPFSVGNAGGYGTSGDNDTRITFPADGVINGYANGVLAVQINPSGLSKIRAVDYVWPNGQGAATTFLYNDGAGNLNWVGVPWATPGAIGSVTPNTAVFSQIDMQGPLVVTGSADLTTGGIRSDSDTGFLFPSDGLIYQYGNNVIGSKWDSNGISEMRGVPMLFPNAQGASGTTLINDGNGVLGWSVPPFGGSSTTVDPVPGGNISHYVTVAVDPSADNTNGWANSDFVTTIGSDGSGFSQGGSIIGLATELDANNKSDFDFIAPFQISSDVGNGTDAISGTNYVMQNNSATFHNAVTVGGVQGINQNINGTTGSIFGDSRSALFIFQADSVASYSGVEHDATLSDLTNNYFGFTDSLNSTETHQGIFNIIARDTVTTADGFVSAFNAEGHIVNGQAYSVLRDNMQFDNAPTNSDYRVLDIGNGGGTLGGFSLIQMHKNITAVTNSGNAMIDVGFNLGSAHGYTQQNWHEHITTMDSNFNGLTMSPQIDTFTGTGGFQGLQINPTIMATSSTGDTIVNVSPTYGSVGSPVATNVSLLNLSCANVHTTGNCVGLHLDGILASGGINSFLPYTLISGGGGPASANTIITQMSAPDGSTITNDDTIGLNTAALINLGAGSTYSAGAFGLGINALGLPAVLSIKAGTTADIVGAAAFAVALDSANTGGTVDKLYLAKATALPEGGTQTVNNLYSYWVSYPFGDPATNSWGLYDESAKYNWMNSNLKIGGASGSTDRVIDNPTLVSLEMDGGMRLNTSKSKPTCDANARGVVWIERGVPGVTDKLLNCLKSAADTYSWIQVATGG